MANIFSKGKLWEMIQQRTQTALQYKAIQPIETKQIVLPDHGVNFLVRQVSSLDSKAKLENRKESGAEKVVNPFLPYDMALFVGDVSDNHICLLNKFNVIEHHLLIVTREFEHQENLLTESDFSAWSRCMNEFNALGFYNGGVTAGASQTHKHMQLIPLPLGEAKYEFPVVPLLQNAGVKYDLGAGDTKIMRCKFPFQHAVINLQKNQLTNDATAGMYLFNCYAALLADVGIDVVNGHQSAPYNLLFTRRWMWLVPRTREFYESISVNALGFAGSLFVRNAEQFDVLRQAGPMEVLRCVTEP